MQLEMWDMTVEADYLSSCWPLETKRQLGLLAEKSMPKPEGKSTPSEGNTSSVWEQEH